MCRLLVFFFLPSFFLPFFFSSLRLVFPWPMALITISFIFAVIQSILPLNITFALVSGGLSGYIMYDLTHYYLHHAVPQNIYMVLHFKNYSHILSNKTILLEKNRTNKQGKQKKKKLRN